MPAAAFAVLLFQGGLKSGKGHAKRLFQPICICLAAINTDAFPAYREKAPRWAVGVAGGAVLQPLEALATGTL